MARFIILCISLIIVIATAHATTTQEYIPSKSGRNDEDNPSRQLSSKTTSTLKRASDTPKDDGKKNGNKQKNGGKGKGGKNDKEKSSPGVPVLSTLANKTILPVQRFWFLWIKWVAAIINIPYAFFWGLPAFQYEAAEWYIQPLPVRIVQALFPLLSSGDWNVLLFLRALIPVQYRLLIAFLSHVPTGPFKFPKKFVGFYPDKTFPHLKVRTPDGSYKRLVDFQPDPLKFLKHEIPDWIYNNILEVIPPKVRSLQKDIHLPTVIIKPWQILFLFPRYFQSEEHQNKFVNLSLQLLRVGAPLLFITLFLNPFNVPGAILWAIIFNLPALITFQPQRWLHPLLLLKLYFGLSPRVPIY